MLTRTKAMHALLIDAPQSIHPGAEAYACSNIALIKYWGKRKAELNLPVTDSLSIGLKNFGATTVIHPSDDGAHHWCLNANTLPYHHPAFQRLAAFLEDIKPKPSLYYRIESRMNIPMAAGLASSACGFASLVKALNAYHGWSCSMKQLSLLARMGSGSACRSLWDGWVHWHAGIRDDGNDSFAEPLAIDWPELCIGLLCLHSGAKKVGSTEAMQRTQATAASYKHWPAQVEHDLERMLASLKDKNFRLLGETAEGNAESMHRLMREASPSIVYSSEATHQAVQRIKNLRAEGLPLYFTQDAGPNLKLLFLKRDHDAVMLTFPELLLTS